jgi:DivIVA domain-containing protein
MDSAQPSPSILGTLRTVEFRLGLKGYNVDEVDEYLEKAAVEAESMQEQLRQANERLRQANERIVQLETERREGAPQAAPAAAVEAPVSDDTLQRTLLLAQRFVDQTKREAEAEANEVVGQAEERARMTLARAEEEARQLVTESQQRLRDEVGRLENMRNKLATDVENMARHLESERDRLRGTLSDMLRWMDENVQPAEALMALRPRVGDGSRGGQPGARPAVGRGPVRARSGGNGDGEEPAEAGAQVLDLRAPVAGGEPPTDDRG